MSSATKKCLWEILVPTMRNDGRPIRLRFHKVWDAKERMIPVRIIATRTEMDKIIDMSLKYYEQLVILAYKVSEEVILRHADGVDAKDIG
jgi:hypothetical protein